MVDSRPAPPDDGDPVVGLVRAFARSTGLSPDDAQPLEDLWQALVEAGDPAPGLSFAVWATAAAIGGPLLPLLSNSPDLGALLELRSPDGGPALADTVDACFGLLCRVLDRLPGTHHLPSRVRLRRTGSAQDARYRELFGVPEFGADADRCSFDPQTLATPIAGADPMVAQLVQPYAERQLAGQGPGWSARVSRTLAERLDAGERTEQPLPTIAEVARTFAVSSRSLQEYLRVESTTYSALLDALRRDRGGPCWRRRTSC